MKAILTVSFCLFSTFSLLSQSYVPVRNDKRLRVQAKANMQAYAFNLSDVKLLKGSPFYHAMQKDSRYLLSIEPDRLLHRFYKNAGLPVKGEIYGGWESEGLSGHTLGHYLSACSMYYAGTGETEFKKRVDYITGELARCQDTRKTGYVGAIPNEDSIFGNVRKGLIHSSGFDLNGGWSPWYTVHKIMAGLLDAYLYCNNQKALQVAVKMADWTNETVKDLDEVQRLKMLNCEYGGMAEVLANIYAITGNKKYLDLSYKFHDKFVMDQLASQKDPMPGKHSNTNVPKAVGSARQYELSDSSADQTIASYFWDIMVHHHSYVIGGNSNYEYCGQEDKLNDRLSDNTCETCNTYNMLKLTRHLFCLHPDREFADYYERALYNHILASQNPDDGMMCYFVPLRMGSRKQFSDPFNTFTCCVGSGMENHVKYNESIYYEAIGGGVYVNLFIPSQLNWKSKGVILTQETAFPDSDSVRLILDMKTGKRFTMYLRHPQWATEGIRIFINGKSYIPKENKAGYLVLDRNWSHGDIVTLILPMSIYTEPMPDNPSRIAILNGPLVLAGQLGKQEPDPVMGVPVLLTDDHNATHWVLKDNNTQSFTLKGVGMPFDPPLLPFYKTYDQYYMVYWDYFGSKEWASRKAEYETDKLRLKKLEESTIDNFRIGEMQPERDHNLVASEKSYVDVALGRSGREARAGNYFTFSMKIIPGIPSALVLTFLGDDKNRKFDILIEGQRIAVADWEGGKTGQFYDVKYAIPSELLAGKDKIIIRIEANYGQTAGRIFGCRTVKNENSSEN